MVAAGSDALVNANCADAIFGDLSESRCDFLVGATAADPATEAVLSGFQDNCAEE